MMLVASGTWDAQRAEKLRRMAYRYVWRVRPPDAPLRPIGIADLVALEAEEAREWDVFSEALRLLMRVAKRQALRKRAA
jgi:hypothetical protein